MRVLAYVTIQVPVVVELPDTAKPVVGATLPTLFDEKLDAHVAQQLSIGYKFEDTMVISQVGGIPDAVPTTLNRS